MILLADGGSTKVDWRLIDRDNQVTQVFTSGANPFFRTRADISEELKNVLVPVIKGYPIEAVYFFGAGCVDRDTKRVIEYAIVDNIKRAYIEVSSDLVAAARGLCGREKGIACVLGTGSNSCYYDGEEIQKNVPPLGYVLGDEGSGAVIGKLFVGACLKGLLSEDLKKQFLEHFDLTPVCILNKVYKEPMANSFLASLSPFILKNIGEEAVYNLVYNSFKDFFIKNVMQYDYKNNKVHLVGSIAYHYQDIIRKAASELGIKLGMMVQSPMQGLVNYYSAEL